MLPQTVTSHSHVVSDITPGVRFSLDSAVSPCLGAASCIGAGRQALCAVRAHVARHPRRRGAAHRQD
eukprot:4977504-Pleurochrysis_carterae.AAC.5